MSEFSLEGLSPEAISGLAMLAKGLSSNPATRTDFLKLAKTADPSLSIVEIDVPAQFNAQLEAEAKKREALEAKIAEQEARENVRARRDELKSKNSFSDADVAELEKIMVDKHIASHETAAEFMLAQRQSAKPTPFSGYGSSQIPKPDLKDFGGNMTQWARNEAAKTISEIRNGQINV